MSRVHSDNALSLLGYAEEGTNGSQASSESRFPQKFSQISDCSVAERSTDAYHAKEENENPTHELYCQAGDVRGDNKYPGSNSPRDKAPEKQQFLKGAKRMGPVDVLISRGHDGVRWIPKKLRTDKLNKGLCLPLSEVRAIRHHKNMIKALNPQAGILDDIVAAKQTAASITEAISSITNMLDRIKRMIDFDGDDDTLKCVFSRLEGLLLLIVNLSMCNSIPQMLVSTLMYVKSWTGSTIIIEKVVSWVTSLLTENSDGVRIDGEESLFFTPTNEFEVQGGWFTANWSKLVEGHFGKRLSSLINLLIIMGLAPEKVTGTMTTELYKVLNVTSNRKKSPSIFHHLFSTLDWLADSVIPALASGNLALLLSDADCEEIDVLYRSCLDAVRLASTGQMKLVQERYGIGDEAELLVLLTNTSVAMLTLKKRLRDDPMMMKELNNRLINLDKLCSDLTAMWHESGLRTKPYAVFVYGASSVGKSILANIACHAICRANGFPEGREYMISINGSDKYQSEYRSKHICVIFDDMGNTKPERCEGNPLFILIQFINNMHCCALSPEAELKGKTDIRSKVVVVTSNTVDLHASYFSVNPASIMRRFACIVKATLKPDAVGQDGGLHEKFAGNPMPDAWILNIGHFVIKRNTNQELADSGSTYWTSKEVGVVELVEHLAEKTPHYFSKQAEIVDSATDVHKKEHCEMHPSFTVPCPKCARAHEVQPLEHQAGVFDTPASDPKSIIQKSLLGKGAYYSEGTLFPTVEECREGIDYVSGDALSESSPGFRERIAILADRKGYDLKHLIGESKKLVEKYPAATAFGAIACVGLAGYGIYSVTAEPEYGAQGAYITRINNLAKEPRQIVERDDAYRRVFSNVATWPNSSVSTTLEQLEAKIDRNLHIIKIQEFDERKHEPIGKIQWCNAFPRGSTEWIVTGHQFAQGKSYKVSFATHPSLGIKRFHAIVNNTNMRPIYGVDAVVLKVSTGGDTYAFTNYMYEDEDQVQLKVGDKIFMYHAHCSVLDNPPEEYVAPSRYKTVGTITRVGDIKVNSLAAYKGFEYTAENFKGLCGSMIFTAGRNPVLIGMHSAGIEGTDRSAAVLLTQRSVMETYSSDDVNIANSSPLRDEIYGVDVTTNPLVHPFNPIHYLSPDKEYSCEVYGQHKMPLSRFKSDVKKSLVHEVLLDKGFEAKDVPPPKKAVRPSRHKHLDAGAEVHEPPNPRGVKLAVDDYLKKLDGSILAEGKKWTEFVHPLSIHDAMSGVAGVKGFGPLNPNTAMNSPLLGPKHKYMMASDALKEKYGISTNRVMREEVDPITGDVQIHYDIIFDPEKADVVQETENTLTFYQNGERANMTFKTFCKDAAISIEKAEKNKLRIISGAPVAMVITSRMLTLALINAMVYFPAEFESAVGVNAAGKDWEYIAEILQSKSGGTRCGCGDYKEYDWRIRPEFSKDAFYVLKYLLKKSNFPDDLLKSFDGLATECIYPIYDIDGLIVKLFGTGPSGQALTVIINGIINSLYMRYAYYMMHMDDFDSPEMMQLGIIPLFHEVIALIVYGDDNDFDVSPEEKLFNMVSVSEELAKIGVVYTNADKTENVITFKTLDEISFLKRGFRKHPDWGVRVGYLDEDSIKRSLMMSRNLPKGSAQSEAEVMAGNMVQACCEAALHSHAKYLEYREILDSLSDIRDDQGFRIGDYYDPPSFDALKERYDATTCCYYKAKEAIEPGGFEVQSGELPDEVDVEAEMAIFRARLEEEFPYFSDITMEDIIAEEIAEFHQLVDRAARTWQSLNPRRSPPNLYWHPGDELSVNDIQFHIWTVRYAEMFHPDFQFPPDMWGEDYRMVTAKEDFEAALEPIRMRNLTRCAVFGAIEYMHDNVDGSCVAFGSHGGMRALNIIRRQRRAWAQFEPMQNEDVNDYIWSFLQPDLRVYDTQDGITIRGSTDLTDQEFEIHMNTANGVDAVLRRINNLRTPKNFFLV